MNYDDIQFYKEGKELEDNDFFLKCYSKFQQRKLQICITIIIIKKK